MMARVRLTFAALLVVLALSVARDASTAEPERNALGEVTVSEHAPGIDPAAVKSTAEHEIRGVDARRVKRRVIVSVAVVRSTDDPVAVRVNATLREAKSGNMIAVIEGRASSDASADAELRRAVLRAAVRCAVRQIPDALSGG